MVGALDWGKSPWADIPLKEIDGFGTPGAMLRAPEKQYLYWLTREKYEGKGAILDLGPLTGGSTVCLAGGLINNGKIPNSDKPKIESYDLFYYDGTWGNLGHRGIHKGDNFFEIYKENITKVTDHVTPVVGDILEVKSYDKPIEILFVDLAKSEELMCHVMKTFFPRVLVGSGIVVHQDYKFVGMPYLKFFQQAFSDFFDILPFPADVPTVAFRLKKDLPDNFHERVDGLRSMPLAERIRLLTEARDQFQDAEWHIMNSSLIFYQCAAGAFEDVDGSLSDLTNAGAINTTAANFYRTALGSHPRKDDLLARLLPS